MRELERLKEMLCEEIKKINSQGELTPSTLEIADTVVDIIKDIMEINEKENQMSYSDEASYRNGYSNNYNTPYGRMPYFYTNTPMDMNNNNSYNNRNNSYGYDNGYSRHTASDQMISKLEMMMQDTSNAKDRSVIQHCIDELKNQ